MVVQVKLQADNTPRILNPIYIPSISQTENNVRQIVGIREMFEAVKFNYVDMLSTLLQNIIISPSRETSDIINSIDENGKSMLMLASQLGHYEIVEMLLEKNADKYVVDSQGLTALTYSIRNHHYEITNLLMSPSSLTKNVVYTIPLARPNENQKLKDSFRPKISLRDLLKAGSALDNE